METIAISNSSSNSKTNSSIEEVSSPSPSPMKPPPSTPPLQERLQRLHSGASVVLDPLEPGNETESRKLSSSKYKGVVPQPNGRWGAQIYEKHQRVWLGTFNKEVEAAQVYDIAAQRFRGRDAVTNFKPLSETNESDALVLFFLDSHSKAEIVDMLRKHTYHEEIQRSWITSGGSLFRLKNGGILRYQAISGISTAREHLFDKVVTPSDVGKLNRLVVPKQHAEKYFPLNVGKNSASNGVLLNFEDSNRKVWRFRYSYWNSSQSYVLTKGWSRFVKEKGLRAGDIVSFHRSNGPDRSLHIDWKRRSTASVGGGSGCGSYRSSIRVQPVRPVEVVRLFGVNIVKSPEPPTVEGGNGFTLNDNWSGKRRRELELLPSHWEEKIVEKERRKEEDIKV